MKRHLTSEEISRLVIGERTAEREAHLRSCAECAAELERVQESLAMFRGAVSEWSAGEERQPAAMSMSRTPSWARWAPIAAALAVALALGIGGNHWHNANLQREQEDEALLGHVRAAVMRPVPATMQPVYDLMVSAGSKAAGAAEEGAR